MFAATMWDDALASDLKLIEILNHLDVTANFAISPGKHGKLRKSNDSRGNFGENVSIGELKEFINFEISNHTMNHVELTSVSQETMQKEIIDGQKFLEDFFGRKINGFCFPYGQHNEGIISFLKKQNYYYARTTLNKESTDSFLIHPTARWNHNEVERIVDYAKKTNHNLVFWGHTYEFRSKADWDKVKNLYLLLKNDPRIEIVSFEKMMEEKKLKS